MEFGRKILSLATTVLVLVIHGRGVLSQYGLLMPGYYKETCPLAEEIVRQIVKAAILDNPIIAASLLRLHFHDCFVMGCDGSVLLDDDGEIVSEKGAQPNRNSLRGFRVIDEIKYALEEACPSTVSCADILALVARDAVVLRGGPAWEVALGRRDSLKASIAGANKFIPSPNSTLAELIANFKQQGLDAGDLVALSGSHTMGQARCISFTKRIYDPDIEENNDPRFCTFQRILKSICPESGSDRARTPLDFRTSVMFDNIYYKNLLEARGLLHSDNVMVLEDYEDGFIAGRVWVYAKNKQLFFESFVKSIIKMGNINILAGAEGEIRKNCRFVNKY